VISDMVGAIIIASLAAMATGIFVWLFFDRISGQFLGYKDDFARETTDKFSELFMFVDVSRYFYFYFAVLIFIPILAYALTMDILVGVVLFFGILFSPHFVLKILAKKRLKKFEKQLPDALVMLSGSLRAGASLSIALDNLIKESPAPLSQEFGIFTRERKLGVDMDTAVTNMEKRIPLEDLYMCFSALQISREVGGNLAETLESLAETLRRKLAMEGKIDSLTSQGKLQGVVMSSLPLLLMIALMKIEPTSMGLMFSTKLGWMVFGMIVVMQILGFLAIKKITEIDV
jgi:tight adherence protein B